MTVEDIMKIEGFKIKSAKNIYDELQNIKEVECRKLLAASSIFGRGFGERKIKMILDVFPFIVIDKERTLSLTVDEIKSIKGMAMISAEQFVNNLPKFMEFYEDLEIKCQTSKKDDQNDGKMKDKKIVFSGFRNKEWESKLQENGGMIATSVSKNIDYLVVKDKNESSSKIKKARELGVTIISCEEFSEKI